MRYRSECIPCSQRQACRVYQIAERAQGREPDERELERVGAQALECVQGADARLTPAEVSFLAIEVGREASGCVDPFAREKRESNELALSLYPRLKRDVAEAADPYNEACLLAVSGNIIDLGIQEGFDLEATFTKVRKEGFARDSSREFRAELGRKDPSGAGTRLLYICDNAGEILFDRLMIETLLSLFPRLEITASVNSGPALNDALMQDAFEVGLTDVCDVIENGHSELGTVLERAHKRFLAAYKRADVILAKGQANYETLDERGENLFFVLKAKCELIAETLEVEHYDAVFVTFPERRSGKNVS